MCEHWLDDWLHEHENDIEGILVFSEQADQRDEIFDDLCETVQEHYLDPEVIAEHLEDLGAPLTAEVFRELLPLSKTARSGDVGEILATEMAEHHLDFRIPIRRLRWKDGRNMALRGDDLIGIVVNEDGEVEKFLKAESKSRVTLSSTVVNEASDDLDRDDGRPTRHSVLFVAQRLRELGERDLSRDLTRAVADSFQGRATKHMIFVITGNNPETILSTHMEGREDGDIPRHCVGIHIPDHGAFIRRIYEAFE